MIDYYHEHDWISIIFLPVIRMHYSWWSQDMSYQYISFAGGFYIR